MIIRNCVQCKEAFKTYQCLLNIGKGRFCSRKCVKEAKADRIATTCPVERFWRLVNKNHPSGCWIWKGSKNALGYGSFNDGNKTIAAHRFAESLKAPLPKGQTVMHDCDNPSCVLHIRRASCAENIADCSKKGRIARGSRHGSSKLTEKDVVSIRELLEQGTAISSIAKKFQVHYVTIFDIRAKRTWNWL